MPWTIKKFGVNPVLHQESDEGEFSTHLYEVTYTGPIPEGADHVLITLSVADLTTNAADGVTFAKGQKEIQIWQPVDSPSFMIDVIVAGDDVKEDDEQFVITLNHAKWQTKDEQLVKKDVISKALVSTVYNDDDQTNQGDGDKDKQHAEGETQTDESSDKKTFSLGEDDSFKFDGPSSEDPTGPMDTVEPFEPAGEGFEFDDYEGHGFMEEGSPDTDNPSDTPTDEFFF